MSNIHICNNKLIIKIQKRGKQDNVICGTHPLQNTIHQVHISSTEGKKKTTKLMVHLVNEAIYSQMTKLHTKLFLPSRPRL